MRIFCQQNEPNHWLAWVDGRSETTFGGETSAKAMLRLVRTIPGVNINDIVVDNEDTTDGLLCYLVGNVCPDCHGSGKYTGLHVIGDCETCGGSGRMAEFTDDDMVPF